MSAHRGHQLHPANAFFLVVSAGILIAIAVTLCVTLLRPAYLLLTAVGGVLLVPTLMVKDPRAYWLFLLVLSIPLEISKHLTSWIEYPPDLVREYGLPATGTLSITLFLTDLILFAMLPPWFARLALRQEKLRFPKIGGLYLLFLALSMINSLIVAPSVYLAICECYRQCVYFLTFLYLANNVVTQRQFRAVILGLFAGLMISTFTVIGFSYFRIGPESYAYSWLYSQSTQGASVKDQEELPSEVSHQERSIKRSAGIFTHPAQAAYYIEYLVPLALALGVMSTRIAIRWVALILATAGCVAIYLTFSRSGLLGLAGSLIAFIIVGWRSQLISRRVLVRCVATLTIAVSIAAPLLAYSLFARPETFLKRFDLLQQGLLKFWESPIFGAGLNNSSAVMEGWHNISTTSQGAVFQVEIIHNHYLIVLIEVGLVGFSLFFGFFGRIAWVALRYVRDAEPTMKMLLVGMICGMASIAVHNLGDPFGGHSVVAMLWLYAGLMVATIERIQSSVVVGSQPIGRSAYPLLI